MTDLNPKLVKTASYINGQWHAVQGKSFAVDNLATEKTIAQISAAGATET